MIYERIGNLKLRTSEDGITRGKLRESVTDGIDTVYSYIFYGAGKAYLPLLEDPSYIEGKLAGYKFKEMASLYLPSNINTSALSGVCANKNSDGSVTLSLSADAGMLSGSSLDVISLRTEGLTHLPKIENPADPTSIKLNCSINKDGYITYLDIEFSFGATLRIDPSNTRQKTMSYKMAVFSRQRRRKNRDRRACRSRQLYSLRYCRRAYRSCKVALHKRQQDRRL